MNQGNRNDRRHGGGHRNHHDKRRTLNFRDIGATLSGFDKLQFPKRPVKPLAVGRLLRSAAFEGLVADAKKIGNPKTVINFRMKKDRNVFGAHSVYLPLPNTDNVYDVTSSEVQVWLRKLLQVLASPTLEFPVLMHCKSGKDRTGVAVAAVLVALGYSDHYILEEFSITPRSNRSKLEKTLLDMRRQEIFSAIFIPEVVKPLVAATTITTTMTGLSGSSFDTKLASTGLPISFLDQKSSIELDVDLMGPYGYTLEQMMELAGLSVACAVYEKYSNLQKFGNVLIICGPGNNGGDGLVAARHLWHFGYRPYVVYPRKEAKTDFLKALQKQLAGLGVKIDTQMQDLNAYPLVIDSMFGFSFKGTPREPYGGIIEKINQSKSIVVCVDVPSGWHVEEGNISGKGIRNPDMLVSLTAPKVCAKQFNGRYHMLGGRFIPPGIATKYKLDLPSYPGSLQCVDISSCIPKEQGKEVTDASNETIIVMASVNPKFELGNSVSRILASSSTL
mmetsp:Transcript_3956/g.5316  ORF Transcript_3956/g.5316 Transcript_3956/m.5316 type:complete len:503 (+) Transcript_3956:7-1515(+)